jgi:DNA-directed RNA polymerase subunit RPC12/RpoP
MKHYVSCSRCGKQVSNDVGTDVIVRAFIECPECVEHNSSSINLNWQKIEEQVYKNPSIFEDSRIDLSAISLILIVAQEAVEKQLKKY